MTNQRNGGIMTTSSSMQRGSPLGECLRDAEADANRFHGGQPQPWQSEGHSTRGVVMFALLAIVGVVGSVLLANGSDHEAVPAANVATAPAETENWMTRAPADVTPDTASKEAPKPPALAPEAERPRMVVLDGGDVDAALQAPASVLASEKSRHTGDEGPRIAPMNVPTLPDVNDRTQGEPAPPVAPDPSV